MVFANGEMYTPHIWWIKIVNSFENKAIVTCGQISYVIFPDLESEKLCVSAYFEF